jgi:hypothetical protein
MTDDIYAARRGGSYASLYDNYKPGTPYIGGALYGYWNSCFLDKTPTNVNLSGCSTKDQVRRKIAKYYPRHLVQFDSK